MPTSVAEEVPGVFHARELALTAVVEDVDYAARIIILPGPAGNLFAVASDNRVRNFIQVKKGDKVRIAHLEAVAVQIMKPEDAGTPGTETAVRVAPMGDKRGLVTTRTEQDSAVVQSIDCADRLAVLLMPDNMHVTVELDPHVRNLAGIAAGDHMVVRRTRAITISAHE